MGAIAETQERAARFLRNRGDLESIDGQVIHRLAVILQERHEKRERSIAKRADDPAAAELVRRMQAINDAEDEVQ